MMRPSSWRLLVLASLVLLIVPETWSWQQQQQQEPDERSSDGSDGDGGGDPSSIKVYAAGVLISVVAIALFLGIRQLTYKPEAIAHYVDTMNRMITRGSAPTHAPAKETVTHLLVYLAGAGLVLAIGGFLIYCLCRKKKKHSTGERKSSQLNQATSVASNLGLTSAASVGTGTELPMTAGSSPVETPKMPSTVLTPMSPSGLPKQQQPSLGGGKSTAGSQISAQGSTAGSSVAGSVISSNISSYSPSAAGTSKLSGASSAALSGVSNFSRASSTPLSSAFSAGSNTSAISKAASSAANSKAGTSKMGSSVSKASHLSNYSNVSTASQVKSNLKSKASPK